jgi:hypothetical protein
MAALDNHLRMSGHDSMTSEPMTIQTGVEPRKSGRVFEWFWRGDKLRQARRSVEAASDIERARLRHARAAFELAGRVLEPVDPLSSEPAYWLATLLYREAAYWALLAQSDSASGSDLASAFAECPRALLLFAADGEEGLLAIERILIARGSVEDVEERLETQRLDAVIARAFVDALIQNKLASTERVRWVVLERWLRTGVAAALLLGAIIGVAVLVRNATRPPDLAQGKPWRLSSSAGECRPAQNSCLGGPTNIFFHTLHEDEPWFELDLGAPRAFSAVELVNRSDCCPDRAIPLVVELSPDAQSWQEVARQKEAFETWRAEFPVQTARYVRVRALRHTALHLVRVSVYER